MKKCLRLAAAALALVCMAGMLAGCNSEMVQTSVNNAMEEAAKATRRPPSDLGETPENPIVIAPEALVAECEADESILKGDSKEKYHNKYIQISGKVATVSIGVGATVSILTEFPDNYEELKENYAKSPTDGSEITPFNASWIWCWFDDTSGKINDVEPYGEVTIVGKGFITAGVDPELQECEVIEATPMEK